MEHIAAKYGAKHLITILDIFVPSFSQFERFALTNQSIPNSQGSCSMTWSIRDMSLL